VAAVSHPIFARCYRLIAAAAEKAGGTEHRRETLAGLGGRVLEVGAGHGVNFAHYPPEVREVVAVEPEPYLRRKAEEAARRAGVTVVVKDGTAEALGEDDGGFDAAVTSLVLCSVTDQPAALSELSRLLRPGGELRFYEHVRARAPEAARRQDRADRWWPLFAGGCHCNRDTVTAIAAAGFVVEEERRFDFSPGLLNLPVAPHVIGRARRR
jgi:ubiquinone/menaquinone biosynthesis C-methylase UbiE